MHLSWAFLRVVPLAFAASLGAEPGTLVHRTGREVTFEVTSNGLSQITFRGRSLATGEWSVFNAESWFSRDATNGPVRAGRCQEQTLAVLSPDHAVVRQRKDDLVCEFNYTFTGEDVTISARVENRHPDAPLGVTGFSGLTFSFDRPPVGLNHAMHPTYLDSFGDSLEDVKLMRWLRERLGPEVRTYCEHQCDAIMPFSGGYSETALEAERKDQPARYRLWSGLDNWELYRWLCPGSELAARLYEKKGQPPAGFETPDEFYARHGIIPLVPVYDFSRAPAIKALQATRPR